MSSRAVRKALKQKEAEALAAKLKSPNTDAEEHELSEGEDDEEDQLISTKRLNLFAMLGGEEGESEEDENEVESESRGEVKPAPTPSSKKKKKKKKKGKAIGLSTPPIASLGVSTPSVTKGEDEIDRALRDLKIRGTKPGGALESTSLHADNPYKLREFLQVESRNLDPQQEMKRLFGKAAVSHQDDPITPPRQRHGPSGQRSGNKPGRVNPILRRNVFLSPKPTWPPAASAGLGMELVEKPDVLEFTFVHSKRYQDVQRQFMLCVLMMDPQRLLNLLQQNPYHISTLLQVSEIADAERDNTAVGEMLERALFSFGRSTHSKFSDAMGRGIARLDFRKFENRELWLAVWRYIRNLGLRGTWRTAEEYGRLLFALDPVTDPYQMILLLDTLSLKAHQPNHLLTLHEALNSKLGHLPNIAYSVSIAYLQLNQDSLAREYLAKAITRFPWVLTRLIQELDIDINPPSVLWGRMVPKDNKYQKILCELYVHRSRDLWNLPDAKKMLKEVPMTIHSVPKYRNIQNPNAAISEDWQNADEVLDGIDINLARHVILSDIPNITSLLPKRWKERLLSMYDPLPPRNCVKTYEYEGFPTSMLFGPPSQGTGATSELEGPQGEPGMLVDFLRLLLPMLRTAADGGGVAVVQHGPQGAIPRVQAIPHLPTAPGGWPQSGELREQGREGEQTRQGREGQHEQQGQQQQQQQQHEQQEQHQLEQQNELPPIDWSGLTALLGLERTRRVRNLVEARDPTGRQPRNDGGRSGASGVNPTDLIMGVMEVLHGDGNEVERQYWGPEVEWEDDHEGDELGDEGDDRDEDFEGLPDLESDVE